MNVKLIVKTMLYSSFLLLSNCSDYTSTHETLSSRLLLEHLSTKDSDKDGVMDNYDRCSETLELFYVDNTGCPLVQYPSLRNNSLDVMNFNFFFTQNNELILNIGDSIQDFHTEFKRVESILSKLEYLPVIIVEGHSDRLENNAYSEIRSNRIKDYLVENLDINDKIIYTYCVGHKRKLYDSDSEYSRQFNRRTSVYIVAVKKLRNPPSRTCMEFS